MLAKNVVFFRPDSAEIKSETFSQVWIRKDSVI